MAFYLGSNKIIDSDGYSMSTLVTHSHETFAAGEFQAQSGSWWSGSPVSRTAGWSSSATSIAVGGGIIAVGDAYYDDGSFTNVGRVDLFDNKGEWFRKLSMTADTYDVDANNRQFGFLVAIGNGVLAVASGPKSVSGTTGKVYLFDLAGNYQREIQTTDYANAVGYPYRMTIGNERLIVTDPIWDSSGAGTGLWNAEGRIHIHTLDDATEKIVTWGEAHRLGLKSRGENSTITQPYFGYGVGAGYGRIYVGAPGDNFDSGQPSFNNGTGSVFILDNDGNFLSKFDQYDAGEDLYPPGPGGSGAETASFGESIHVGQGMVAVQCAGFEDNTTTAGGDDEGALYLTTLNGEHLLRHGVRSPFVGTGLVDSSIVGWDTQFSNDFGFQYNYNGEAWIDNDRIYLPSTYSNSNVNQSLNVLYLDGAAREATLDANDSAIRGTDWPTISYASGGLWANVDYTDNELNVQNSNLTLSGYLDKVLRKT